MWGVIHKSHLPIRWETDTLTAAEGTQATRIMRRWRQRAGRFWLHSKSSHDSLRTQGKPVEWRRLRLAKIKRLNGVELNTEAEWLGVFRSHGFRVKLVKPRLFRRIGCKLWDQDEDTGRVERRRVVQKRLGDEWVDEIHSACSGWHFIDVRQFAPVVQHVKGIRPGAPLTSCEKRWLHHGTVERVRAVRKIRADGASVAGGCAARRVASSLSVEDLRWLHECGWFDAPGVESSDSA
jgi:hypothetical protein